MVKKSTLITYFTNILVFVYFGLQATRSYSMLYLLQLALFHAFKLYTIVINYCTVHER